MMRRPTLAALALGALFVPPAAGQDYVGREALQQVGMSKFWQLQLPLLAGQRVIDVYLVDDQIYATTNDGYAYAVHAHTGVLRWSREVTRAGYRLPRPGHAGDRVIFVTPSAITQFDRVYGRPILMNWARSLSGGTEQRQSRILLPIETRFPASTGAVSDGRLLFVGGLDHRLYAFRLNRDFETWKAGVFGPITSTPVLRDGWLYVADQSGGVYTLRPGDKALRWAARTTGPITADIAVDGDGVYAPSQDRSLWSFDLEFGEVRWRARLSGALLAPPAVTRELVYQFTEQDGLVAINNPTFGIEERIRWTLPRGRQLLTTDARHAYVRSRDGAVLAVRLSDGGVLHEIPAAGLTMGMPAPHDQAIYLAAPDGRLFCARPQDTPLVSVEDIRRAWHPPAARPDDDGPVTAQRPALIRPEGGVGTAPAGPPIGGKSKISRNWGRGE